MGWVISESLITSRRFNRLNNHECGEFAQLLYVLSYTHADAWGHIPFDYEWVKLNIFPGSSCTVDKITIAMVLLVVTELWGCPYVAQNNYYVYIFNFEEKCREGIRRRRKGRFYAENGETPTRQAKEDFDENLVHWKSVRENANSYILLSNIPTYSATFRNVSEHVGICRQYRIGIGIGIGIGINKTETPSGGFLEKFPKTIKIGSHEIRKSYLYHVLNTIGGDEHQLYRILYRAKASNDPYAYIERGIKEGYIYKACLAEDLNPSDVRLFIDGLCGIKPEPKRNQNSTPESIGDIINTFGGQYE